MQSAAAHPATSSSRAAAHGEESPDGDDGDHLKRGQSGAESVRQRPVQILRAEAGDDLRLVAAELLRRQERCRAEALDLERTTGLALEARLEAVGRERSERDEDHREHEQEHGQSESRLPAPLASSEVEERDGQQNERVELRSDRQAEHGEGEPAPPRHERGQRADGEHGRPDVEPRQEHRPERERSEPEERRGCVEALGPGADGHQGRDCEDDRRRSAQGDESLERRPVVVARPERRQCEHREGTGWVLEAEISIGTCPPTIASP